jgi:hypothetical protein
LRLINGCADPNSGSHMVNRWLSLAPSADVVRLEHVGHWPQIEAARSTAASIVDFWSSLQHGDGSVDAPGCGRRNGGMDASTG